MKKITLLLVIIFTFLFSTTSWGEWDEYCTSKARQLYRYSGDAESAKSELESAKSELESACSDWGYQKDDEYACGSYGYVRSNYDSAKSNFDSAVSEVEYAASSANRYCGGTNGAALKNMTIYLQELLKENKKLKERIKNLEKK